MKSLPAILLMIVATSVSAQPLVSPEVHADGHVTFRLKAPNAKEVVLRCEGTKGGPMQKGEGGVWSITTDPMQPDIYAYSFSVDGVKVIDPANPLLKYNLLNTDSQVHMPGPATLAWEINDVPHGVVHRHLYRSAILGDDRPFVVYAPPGYDPAAKQTYPVLYLLHGYSDAEDAWTTIGRANIILDNLIARGQAKPMLIVMPLGYGNKEVIAGGWAGLRNTGVWQDSIAKFRNVLLKEVIPQVEKAYRVGSDPDSRAIAGLSMGGTQSLLIGLNAPDRFGWIGAFSSGGLDETFEKQFPAVNESINSRLHLLWIGCGQQDGLIGTNRKLVEWLKSKGVNLTWVETPGTHSFTLWRRYLADLVLLLFQDKPSLAAGSPAVLVARMANQGASWEERCAAEDGLANTAPEEGLRALLPHISGMPSGAIWNSAGREYDKDAPIEWQIFYAVSRSWTNQVKRLPKDQAGDFLHEVLHEPLSAYAKTRILNDLTIHWTPHAESTAAHLLKDPDEDLDVRTAAAIALIQHGRESYYEFLLRAAAEGNRASRQRWYTLLMDPKYPKGAEADPRVVAMGFSLVQEELRAQPDYVHGAYFLVLKIGDYIGKEFKPDQSLARYQGKHGLTNEFFEDTVKNAMQWWERNRDRLTGSLSERAHADTDNPRP